MTTFKPSIQRKCFIDRKIREKTYPTTVTLARDYEKEFGRKVDPRTIANDISDMKKSLKAPIKYDPENHGYFYTNTDWTLDFINPELLHLPAIAETLDMPALDFFQNLNMETSTLAGMFFASSWRKNPLSRKISVLTDSVTEPLNNYGIIIKDALENNKELVIEYNSIEDNSVSCIFHPFHFVRYKDENFILGFSPGGAVPYMLLHSKQLNDVIVKDNFFPAPECVHIRTTQNGEIEASFLNDYCSTILVFVSDKRSKETKTWSLFSKTEIYGRNSKLKGRP